MAAVSMATALNMPMDALRIIENINATVATRFPAPTQHTVSVSSIPSDLCTACKSIFDVENTAQPSSSTLPDGRRPGEVFHNSLEDLAARAVQGCHLCLTVYLGLDPDLLKNFRRMAVPSNGRSFHDAVTTWSIGYAQLSPVSRDQARLRFRWTPPSKGPSPEEVTVGKLADSLGRGFLPGIVSASESRSTLTSWGSENGGSSSRKERELRIELLLVNPKYAVEPGVQNIHTKSTTTASTQSFETAKRWIQDCAFNHMKCSVHEGAGPIWKPPHLLDVTVRSKGGAPGVKLVDGMFLDPLDEYCTLSHCWGSSQVPNQKRLRLHKGTLAALRQGVAGSSLPKTLAEAAVAAERLGFKYLWIDALCIMHDSEKEVLEAVSSMHRIYSEASLNLAATSSREDAAGLFYNRNVAALQPVVVDVAPGFGIDGGVYKILRSTTWQDLVDSAPLSRRAWAFQERCLSKRTLHFTRNELMWECQQTCASEVFPRGLPVVGGSDSSAPPTHNGTTKNGSGNASSHGVNFEKFNKRTHHQRTGNWHQLVYMYSRGKQSYTSDKLLGIAGLAKQYSGRNRLRETDYVVGHWRPHLPYTLLWRVDHGRRPPRYRAPTWSWASIDGSIVLPDTQQQASKQTCLEVVDISTKHKFNDSFGPCESATLKVRGFVGKGSLRRTQDYWGRCSFTVQFPVAPGPSSRNTTQAKDVTFVNASFDDRLPKLSDGGVMTETLEVYLLPVVDTLDRVEGLILCATMTRGEFRRLGVFQISTTTDQDNWDVFKTMMKGDADMDNYEERLDHSNGYWFASDYTYTINIL